MISQRIGNLGQIHPDLIYFYIKELEIKSNSYIDQKLKIELLYEILQIKNSYITKRDAWAKQQIKMIDESKYNRQTRKKAKKYFESLITHEDVKFSELGTSQMRKEDKKRYEKKSLSYLVDSMNVVTKSRLKIDNNLKSFFTLLYLNEAQNLSFDEKNDYTKKVQEIFKDKKYHFEADYNLRKSISDLSRIQYYLSFWYLFHSNDMLLNELNIFVSDVIYNYNKTLLNSEFSSGISYLGTFSQPEIKESIDIEGRPKDFNVNEKMNINAPAWSINYAWKISESLESFSYFKFTIGGSILKQNQKIKADDYYYKINTFADTYHNEVLNFSYNDITIKSANNFYLAINTPIYILTDNIYLEGGLAIQRFEAKYRIDYAYSFRLMKYDPVTREINYTKTAATGAIENESIVNWSVYPILGLYYKFLNHFGIYLGAFPMNYNIELIIRL